MWIIEIAAGALIAHHAHSLNSCMASHTPAAISMIHIVVTPQDQRLGRSRVHYKMVLERDVFGKHQFQLLDVSASQIQAPRLEQIRAFGDRAQAVVTRRRRTGQAIAQQQQRGTFLQAYAGLQLAEKVERMLLAVSYTHLTLPTSDLV